MSAQVSFAPRTGAQTAGPEETTPAQFDAIVAAAARVRRVVAQTPPATRRRWLDAVADALEAASHTLVPLADEETALGPARLRSELTAAAANARYYGRVGPRGDWMNARIDRGTPDLRRADLPIGVVAVFGASNFPFQFGTVGHDTCAALAAGCPVVAKAHPAHPRLAVALTRIVQRALTDAGAPAGTFDSVVGFEAGRRLVQAPQISAVGFTGSQRGGMALVDLARQRPVPIPVYAEMGTVNPVVVTPAGASAAGADDRIARGFVDSFTLGAGQFCTKPGLLLTPRGSGLGQAVADEVARRDGAWLLTETIAAHFASGVAELVAAGATLRASGSTPDAGYAARPAVLDVPAASLAGASRLREECFGPVALVTDYDDLDHAEAILAGLQGSLAGSIITAGPDDPAVPRLVAALSGQVGRVAVDAWPTGVACTDGMHHGGPWPATSVPSATSVGGQALARFTRPVCFQGAPQAALPPALQDANPWSVMRTETRRGEA